MKRTACVTPQPFLRVIGYLHVSTADQDLEKNKADILTFANERKLGNVDWVEEKVSGAKTWRNREISKAVESLNAGDWLIVAELSRLRRSTLDILDILAELKKKGKECAGYKGSWIRPLASEFNGWIGGPPAFKDSTALDISRLRQVLAPLTFSSTRPACVHRRRSGYRPYFSPSPGPRYSHRK